MVTTVYEEEHSETTSFELKITSHTGNNDTPKIRVDFHLDIRPITVPAHFYVEMEQHSRRHVMDMTVSEIVEEAKKMLNFPESS